MLLVFVLDALFVGASVYLILNEQVLAGVVMMLMGMVATGIGLVRVMSNRSWSRERRTGMPLFAGANRGVRVAVMLEPAEEDEIRDLARENKIAAIKRVRELTGAGLKEAKEYVDRLD